MVAWAGLSGSVCVCVCVCCRYYCQVKRCWACKTLPDDYSLKYYLLQLSMVFLRVKHPKWYQHLKQVNLKDDHHSQKVCYFYSSSSTLHTSTPERSKRRGMKLPACPITRLELFMSSAREGFNRKNWQVSGVLLSQKESGGSSPFPIWTTSFSKPCSWTTTRGSFRTIFKFIDKNEHNQNKPCQIDN